MQPVSFYLTDKNIISILNRVDKTESCWNWKGIIDIKTGYGRFKLKSGYHVAHRLVYTIFNGEITEGKILDHTCRNRNCVNPEHLREVDYRTNMLENSLSNSYLNSLKTECNSGHAFSAENTYIDPNNRRHCKICRRKRDRVRDKLRKQRRKVCQ